MSNTLIFDIGKTNKKAFIFDQGLQVIWQQQRTIEEVTDLEGFPCEDINTLEGWITEVIETTLSDQEFEVSAINFSTYGASLVYVDEAGSRIGPLHNYMKPMPKPILDQFFTKHGAELTLSLETASPSLGMLNSGMHLYWLKYTKPELFGQIRWALHLPQYLSYRLSRVPVSDYTSIGCHTFLWDYSKREYHDWVVDEKLDKYLAPIVESTTNVDAHLFGKTIPVGCGVHDSSAALIPYLRIDKEPFALLSTGTWSITICPFNHEMLSREDLAHDTLHFMKIDGTPVKASRLFLGYEYEIQLKKICLFYQMDKEFLQRLRFDEEHYDRVRYRNAKLFCFEHLKPNWSMPKKTVNHLFRDATDAYYQLLYELTELQCEAFHRACGSQKINKLYVDGGFVDNKIFVQMMARQLPKVQLITSNFPLGSSIGAAILVTSQSIDHGFLTKNCQMESI